MKETNNNATAVTTKTTAPTSIVAAWPATFALLLGVFLLYGAGFAGPQIIHDAAHDTRHSFSFPCH